MFDNGIKECPKILAGRAEIAGCRTCPAACVQHRKLDLVLGGIQINEEIVDFVQYLSRPRVSAIDLVDDDKRRQPRSKAFRRT